MILRTVGDLLGKSLVIVIVYFALITVLHFPMATDGPPMPAPLIEDVDDFYEAAYEEPADGEILSLLSAFLLPTSD